MLITEISCATAKDAMKGFSYFRRNNPEIWAAYVVYAPNGAVVRVKMFGKKTVQLLEVVRDGNVSRFPSLWDEKAGVINKYMREALEVAYAS